MADRKILASNLRQMAAWCKSGEDDDGSGTFIPAYPSGDVYDILTEAARELDATAAPVVVGEDVGLLKFVAEVMEDWHEGDLDGGVRQDWAEKYGLLIPVEVTESGGENCGCSEYGDFPLTCYRPSPVLLRCRAALAAALAGD